MKTKLFLFILLTAAVNVFAQSGYQDLTVQEFQSKMTATPGAVLLDVRTPDETAKGVIPSAKQLDYFKKDFESEVAKLDKSKTYFLYCAAGGRSGETAELMTKLGFKNVYNLKEGFEAWKKAKMPIEPVKK
jgi:rhodanese-related sulfurtransferase